MSWSQYTRNCAALHLFRLLLYFVGWECDWNCGWDLEWEWGCVCGEVGEENGNVGWVCGEVGGGNGNGGWVVVLVVRCF